MKQGIRVVINGVGVTGGLCSTYEYPRAPVMVRGGSQPVGPDAMLVHMIYASVTRHGPHRAGLQDVRGGHRNRRDSRTYLYGRTW